MPHELTHWIVHAMLGDTGWGRNLPPAFAEGLALNVDEVDRSELAKIAQQLNVQAEASAAHNRGCPSADREYHRRISFSSLRESFDVVIQNTLTRRTFDLDECNLASGGVLGFNVNPFPRPADGRYAFLSCPRQDEVDEVLEVLR